MMVLYGTKEELQPHRHGEARRETQNQASEMVPWTNREMFRCVAGAIWSQKPIANEGCRMLYS